MAGLCYVNMEMRYGSWLMHRVGGSAFACCVMAVGQCADAAFSTCMCKGMYIKGKSISVIQSHPSVLD